MSTLSNLKAYVQEKYRLQNLESPERPKNSDAGYTYNTSFIVGVLGYMFCTYLNDTYGYWPAAVSLVLVWLLGSRLLVGRWLP